MEHDNRMHELLPLKIRKQIPPLYWTEKQSTPNPPLVYVRFFSPFTPMEYFVLEFDGEDTFYGLILGLDADLGYFSLKDLATASHRVGGNDLPAVVRDLNFKPVRLDEVADQLGARAAVT